MLTFLHKRATVFDKLLCPTAVFEYQIVPFSLFSGVIKMCRHIVVADAQQKSGTVLRAIVANFCVNKASRVILTRLDLKL